MISVVVLTYNDPCRLRLCLHSLLRQTRTDFELVVVHDGGDRQINEPVYAEMRRHGRDIAELWLGPESTEFRAAAARNLGLRHAHGERVLFVDGDSILAPNVVAAHASYGSDPVLVNGARKHLPQSCLAWLQPRLFDQLEPHVIGRDQRHESERWVYRRLQARLAKGETVVPLDHYEQVWGFQFSVPARQARQIGGLNEEFVGYGGEDQEFAARLKRAGVSLLGRFDVICYHLDHPSRAGDRVWTEWMIDRFQQSVRRRDPVRNGGALAEPTDS